MYMRRALALAKNGKGFASPNPMVGAVIVAPDGRIIGEGWHRRCGEGHAEVNAVGSVRGCDRNLLPHSTMFVTLEPCSHYGRTPPCAELIIATGIPRVVVATTDPFEKVAGRGIAMLRNAGVEVVTGVLERESRELNRRFFTAHIQRRPFVTLKWAQSADGFMDWVRHGGRGACRFSNPLTGLLTMRLRSLHDAVLTTAATVAADRSRLTVRGWDGRTPKVVLLDRSRRITADAPLFAAEKREVIVIDDFDFDCGLSGLLRGLYADHGLTSVLIEAGPTLLGKFLDEGLWDAARVETAPFTLGREGAARAPQPQGHPARHATWDGNDVAWFVRSE